MITAMIDMSKSAEQLAEDMKPYDERTPKPADVPMYPYGLCICLDEDSLKKLGLDESPAEAGDGVQLIAMAKVTSSRSTEGADGKPHRSIELQITHMALGPEHAEQEVVA